jgi:hypothetical protein
MQRKEIVKNRVNKITIIIADSKLRNGRVGRRIEINFWGRWRWNRAVLPHLLVRLTKGWLPGVEFGDRPRRILYRPI